MHLEPLITSGFVSRRRSIVNISIGTWNKTFGKEESLRYPARLEKALRRLRSTVDLSLPSLEVRDEDSVGKTHSAEKNTADKTQLDGLSFYESDTGIEDAKRAFKSPRVKESPFKISKSARRSLPRSPAVPTPGSRRSATRQTNKVRLAHNDSQVVFEEIQSSPTNPFNQESQVLTERQKEMVERHRLSSGLFTNMAAPSPQRDAQSPMELHSDALTVDDLPADAARITPLKAIAEMGPMDAFLGSSPTPHARKSTRKIVSDEVSVATPTAVRTANVMDNTELGSSPPQFDKHSVLESANKNSDILVGSSFEYRQPDAPLDGSFDEGTTIDEETLLVAGEQVAGTEDRSEHDASTDVAMSDVPSSAIDLQLTAQLDADIQAHMTAATPDIEEVAAESINDFVDAASHPPSSEVDGDQAGSDTEVQETQIPSSMVMKSMRRDSEGDASILSRVGDSFSKEDSEKGTPRSRSLRRSSRHSLTSSPTATPSKLKRKQTQAKQAPKAPESETVGPQETQVPAQPSSKAQAPQPDEDGMLDNIVVASPVSRPPKAKKRKSMNEAPTVHVPETTRKRGPVHSRSALSQVENSQSILVEDTPAPKRPKQSANQDVSKAKSATPPPAQGSQTKRLSHVQVTPKRSSEYGGSVRASSVATSVAPSESQDAALAATPSRSFTERVILTPRSIIQQLKSLKDYLFSASQLVLGREEEREIDDALFDIRRQVHAAGLRGDKKMNEGD